MWSTSDSTVANVDSDGVISSWLAGDAILTAAITPQDPGLPSSITVPVTVAIQQNPMCVGPTEFPLQPPVGPAPVWGEVPNAFAGAQLTIGGGGAYRTSGDFDGDGDEDFVVTDYDPRPPNGVGRSRFWRNVGGTFEDATAAVFEPDSIPDWGVGNDNNKADFNGDGVLDLFRAHIRL